MFSGSYKKEDVEILLKVIDIDFTEIEAKEKLIQSGKKHYSEMINQEYVPTENYLETFHHVYKLNKNKFANDILTLAYHLNKQKNIVLISLARAGTPIGVLLTRVLKEIFKRNVKHYSISIIRDREIDNNALDYIYNNHSKDKFIFIDGWTGKGVINRELKKFIKQYNIEKERNISDTLYVISDIAGVSDFAVNYDDYLIPSSALNSTVSGLVSRSILNSEFIGKDDYHGCKYYEEYLPHDMSLWFVDDILNYIKTIPTITNDLVSKNQKLITTKKNYIEKIMNKYDVSDLNHIKPGIGESTRVLLRRVPYIIMVKDIKSKDITHLIQLAKEKNVSIIEDQDLPYTTLAIIKNILQK